MLVFKTRTKISFISLTHSILDNRRQEEWRGMLSSVCYISYYTKDMLVLHTIKGWAPTCHCLLHMHTVLMVHCSVLTPPLPACVPDEVDTSRNQLDSVFQSTWVWISQDEERVQGMITKGPQSCQVLKMVTWRTTWPTVKDRTDLQHDWQPSLLPYHVLAAKDTRDISRILIYCLLSSSSCQLSDVLAVSLTSISDR